MTGIPAVEAELRQLLAEVTGRPDLRSIPADTALFGGGVGLDSLSGTLLLRQVERKFGVDVAAEDLNLDSLESLGTLAAFIVARLGKPGGREKSLDGTGRALTSSGAMRQDEIWDREAAQGYDSTTNEMFTPEVLGSTVNRLAELAGDGQALEFAIGTGRVAIPLAERGVPVTGIELSAPMIEQLRTKVDETAIPVITGDMATTRAPGTYSLVYLVYNTISNLLTQPEQTECFRNAARHLAPGGRFVIELWVPELRRLPPGQQATVFASEPGYIGLDTYDVLNQRIVSHHFSFGDGREARLFRSPHRYIWPSELDLMAQLAGFELESRHADWAGAEFTAESRSHVSVYRLT